MSKVLKGLIKSEIGSVLGNLDGGVFISYAGLDSEAMYGLRTLFQQDGVSMRVIPNRIAAKALQDLKLSGADIRAVLRGDTALIYAETAVAAARSVKKRIASGVKITWKGAFLEREVYDATKAPLLAELPTRDELLGQIAACYQSSAQKIASCFQQSYKKIAGCFLSLEEKIEESGGAAPAAAEAQAPAAEAQAPAAEAQAPAAPA